MAVTPRDKPLTPSESIVAEANGTVIVTDARGRAITIKRLNALDRMRMFEAIGADNCANPTYLGYAGLAYMVVDIDGDRVTIPRTKLQFEALIGRLEDDGLNAIATGAVEHFGVKESEDTDLKNE
jgi:hypothetical protein